MLRLLARPRDAQGQSSRVALLQASNTETAEACRQHPSRCRAARQSPAFAGGLRRLRIECEMGRL
jgi:hypothetical protein